MKHSELTSDPRNPIRAPGFIGTQISGLGELISNRTASGAAAHLLTVMFPPIAGSNQARLQHMRDRIERIFSIYITNVCRDPNSAPIDQLPALIGSFDLPVYKRDKTSGPSALNQGLHFHGTLLTPEKSRLKQSVEDHFASKRDAYTSNGRLIQSIHIEPITHDPVRVMDYALKTVKNGGLTYDDGLLILPKARSEITRD